MRLPREVLDQYFAAVTSRNTAAAVALAVELADEGVPLDEVCVELVASAQIEVGERWHRNEYSVADEHAATAVADTVVSVLTAYSPPAGPGALHVAVVCAEGEWHALAARLIAETLRAEGHDVTYLGASLPSSQLGRYLDGAQPDVVAISCSTALAFDGVLACTGVTHEAGIPVMVGGRAFGMSEGRARALGADLWAPDAKSAVALLRDPLPPRLAVPTVDVDGARAVTAVSDQVVDAAVDHLARTFPPYGSYTQFQKDHTREDFRSILQFARASVLTHDPSLFAEFLRWLDVLLRARGLPAAALERSLAALRHAVAVHPDTPLEDLFARALPAS